MKKGLIKIGVIGFLSLFLFGIIAFSLFSSAYSNIPEERGNSVIFDFKSNNTYPLDTVLRLDFTKLGNYKLIINSPSKEVISRVSSNDNFLLKLEEEGEYSVVVQRGNGKKVYYFFVISSGQESPEEQKLNPEDPVQEKAEINKPVEWTQTISEENLTNLIEIPPVINLTLTDKTGEEISYTLTNIDGKNYINLTESLSENISGELKIEYTTEPPKIEETIISNTTKEVVVSSLEGLNYKNVLSYTYLPREIYSKSSIKIYWKENNTYLDFNASDTNGNGLFDYVEWITPHLSSQTFEIIVIIKAEHLDSNKNFISDIYEQVKEKDNLWSEEIREGEYVRVTFEVPLDSTRDITLFPRIISGNPIVEVYEKDKNELIAQFDNLISNEYNKVYLTNLQSQQDIFDLKVVGGILEFDHIIDPNFYARTGVTYYYAGTPTQITFSTAMPDTNYSILFSGQQDTDAVFSIQYDNKATTGFRINRVHDDGGANESAGIEWAALSFGEFDFQNISVKCNSGSGSSTSVINFESSFPDTNYAVVAYTPWDSDSPRVSYSSKSTGSWNSVILDDGGALEAVSSIDWCAVSYGTETIGGIIIKAGSDTASGPTSKVIQLGSSFPDTNYVVVTTASRTGTADPCEIEVSGKTTTSFTVTAEDDDTTNNCNGREFNWIAISTGEFFLDLTNPTFISIPENTSIFYENESLGVDFDAIDETGFGYYSVNDTRFSINQSGFLTNSTSLSGGNYLLNISINDTSNNLNWTLYSLEVKKFSLPCFVYFNTSSPVTYPETFRVYTNCSSNHNLFMNGTQILNNSIIDSGAGYYNFTSERQENENYTYYSDTKFFRIDKNTEVYNVLFNTSSPIYYPETFRVYSNPSSAFTLYRNETIIENNSEQSNGAGYFVYLSQRTDEQNYSLINVQDSFTVLKSQEFCSILFNETFPLSDKNSFLVWTNCSGQVRLYRDSTLIENNSEQFLSGGVYNFSFSRLDTENYSQIYDEKQVIIQDTIIPLINFGTGSTKNNSKFARDWIYVDVEVIEENEENITFNLYNSNRVLVNSSTYTDLRREINWTNLPEGIYYFNVTVFDKYNHFNSTSTRKTTLNFTLPTINFVSSTEENGVSLNRNWIYANVSAANVNEEINVTFGLYNDLGLFNQSIYTDSRREINWTNLPEGMYYYNVTLFDNQDGRVSTLTRSITLDSSPPNIINSLPEDNSIVSHSSQIMIADISDNLGLSNFTFSIYNETHLINQTYQDISGLSALTNIFYDLPHEGVFKWNYNSMDLAGNYFLTPNLSLIYDLTSPLVDYTFPTPDENVTLPLNFLYVNVSVIEGNLANITFNLYDFNQNLLNSSTYTDSRREINWTNLPEGVYYYNVIVFDLANNYNYTSTRQISLDLTAPNATLLFPENNSLLSDSTQNLTVNISDNLGLSNMTLFIYDKTNLINETTQEISGTEIITGIVYNFVYDGIFKWFYKIFDLAGNSFETEKNTITIDTTAPIMVYGSGTPPDFSRISRNWIYISASINEANFANITFNLYFSNYTLLNSSTYTDSRREINWTNLQEGTYYYNITSFDLLNHSNTLATRRIKIDMSDPNLYTRAGTTTYTARTPRQITFSTAMPTTDYSILFSGQQDTDAVFSIQYDNKATTGFRINRVHDDGGANESAGIEWAALSFGEFDFQNISVKCNSGSGSSTSVINFESSFPDTNYAVVAYTPWDSDSPRVSYSSKSTGSWNSVILDDGGALEAVSSIDWCAVSYGTETIGGIIIKAGSDTASGPTSKVIQLGSSFPDTNYVVVTTASRTGTADPCEIEVSGKTTTSFTVTAEDDDTTNNCNGREFNWIAISTGEFFLDLTNPTFISIPENTSIFYENESLGVDFDAIDETGFGYYSVNDTRFSINQSGFLTNSTSLSGGNYLLNISINDTSNNLNWTLYSLEVKKFSLPCFVYFNTSSPVTYPETFRVYTNCSSNHNLFMNGTQILNNSIIDSGAGYYNFTSERQENENYTYIFHQREFIVLKNPEICEIFFNETSPINYPATFQVWANCTSPFTLYRNGTEILNNSEQKLAAGTYNFSMFRLDSQNFSYTYDYSYFTIDELLDVTPPYFTQIPNNASLFYKNQSLGVNFDATDNINFGFYKINDTRFSINQTGYLSNSTSLAAGNYAINVSINDSSNNINWTIYTVQVNKSTFYDCGVYFNTLSPITYPETFIVYTNCSSAYTIYRNGTSIPNNSIINSGAGYYNITVQRTDTQNYTNFFSSEFFIVNKGTPTATLSSSAGWELTYPTSTTISSTNHLQGDSDLIYRIYRNNTNINTGETITLGAGFYNYILNTTGGANYTSHSNLDTENLIIQKNTEQFKVQFNTSSPITYPETFRVYTNSTSPFRLYRDGIIISNNSEQKLGVGSYNFSAYRTDTLNYSFSYTDSFFTINKNPEICQVLFNVSSPIDSTETFRVWANCTSSFNLYRNGTLIPNNSEQSLVYGVYNFSMLRTDTQNYTAYYNETEMVITDSVSPLIDYVFPTPENNSNSSQNWIYLNVSVVEKNLKNITFNLYYINNTLKNSTTFTDSSRSINLTSLEDNSYLFNVTIFDIVGNYNFTETRRINLDTIPPEVNLLSGNYLNFSGTLIPFLNFSVDDLNEISNCTLYGDWAGGWHINETFLNPQKKTSLSFYNKEMVGEGHYLWNVLCYDNSGNFAFNSTNFTFAAFFFPESPNSSLITISQTNDDGTGEVIIDWEPANHSDYYKIYYTDDLKEEFSFLAQTNKTNYVDNFANSTRRRFYKLSNWNPTGENFSNIALGKTVYYLKRKDEINNKNWLGFYLNNSNLDDANNSLNFINNITAFTMWNSTLQRKVTCNEFSCPNFPSCTETNCNFNLQEGAGYEVNLNPHSSEFTNWSLVGTVKDKVNIMLFTNLSSSTFYGKNWISLYANSSLEDAFDLINNISYADSVTNWNEFSQISEGYIKNNYSSMPPYFGLNFVLEPEKGYEVSVTQDSLYTQS